MSKERFLRVPDGTIHGWNEWLAMEPGVVEVTEEMAYPERFVKGGKRKAAVDMSTEEENDPENDANLATGLQASKRLEAASTQLSNKEAGIDKTIGKHGTTPNPLDGKPSTAR